MRVLLVAAPAIADALDGILARLDRDGIVVETASAADLTTRDLAGVTVIAGPGSLPCDAALLARAPELRGLVSIGSGCEGFDQAAARRRAIAIRTGATVENIEGMASATVMLMLALCHDLAGAQAACRRGGRRSIGRARTLDDAVVGLVGFGAIGRSVARRLHAWGIRVLAFSPSRRPGTREGGTEFVTLDDLLAASDVISLHAALNEGSRNLLDAARLARTRPGALIVNTARGGLIDEAALAAALTSGAIGGAALDCFEREPLPADSPLFATPNLILTPHQIGHTAAGARSVVDAFVDNILSFTRAA